MRIFYKVFLIVLGIVVAGSLKAQDGEGSSFTKNGIFIDGLAGFHTLSGGGFSRTSPGFAFRVGSKWYLKEGEFGNVGYGMGFQATWLRMGIYLHGDGNSIQTVPLMPGFTSVWKINEKIILEGNMNMPFLSTDHDLEIEDGIFVLFLNPEVKIRYNQLTAGIDIVQSFYTMDGEPSNAHSSLFVFSFTAGVKF